MIDSYKNPFTGGNAVQLKPESILEYWCSPFRYRLFSQLKQEDIYEEEMNIVIQGGRSTGKSMFLRYWSYPVQLLLAKKNNKTFFQIVNENCGIGFYIRMDGPMLNSFQGKDITDAQWSDVFIHYFELLIGRQYIETLKILNNEHSISRANLNTLIPKVCKLLSFSEKKTLDEILDQFDEMINQVDLYRGNVSFDKKNFRPEPRGYGSQSISFILAELIKAELPELRDINFIILLDEFENFFDYQQLVINTLLKFSRPQIKFRVGMRPEGFRTLKTVSKDDFINEDREYKKVVFEEVLAKEEGYHAFLYDVAEKRLNAVGLFREKGFINIKNFLLEKEDLEREARDLVKSSPDRIYDIFRKSYKIPSAELKKVRYKENPLLELLNFIWLLRGVSTEKVKKSMNDYLSKKNTDDARKYRMDYVNKYKLSLMFLLCRIYHKPKKYYSFNTFAFLSSGVIGRFINLCREAFDLAEWENKQDLIEQGIIRLETQSKSATKFSVKVRREIGRIEQYGGEISRFVENIGSIFREYHSDIRMRYPETNQFAMNINTITNERLSGALRSAIKWSIIQSKPKMQSSEPGGKAQELYTLNRIFSPTFQITYRTRGGKSVTFTEQELSELMYSDEVKLSKFIPKKSTSNNETSREDFLPLFPIDYE